MKRTPLKRNPSRRDTGDQQARDNWRTWAAMHPCAICRSTNRVEGHHVIPKQELRRRGLEELMWDQRNCLPLCRSCHDNHEAASRRVLLSELLPGNWEFVKDLDLVWLLRRSYR